MNTMALKSHAKWLRKAAKEIRDKGHAGWGNTCEQAADAIDAHVGRQSEGVRSISACKGKNCGCTDGVSHSPECISEHEACIDPLNTSGNRNPEHRYAGYKGHAFTGTTDEHLAAYMEGKSAALTAVLRNRLAQGEAMRDDPRAESGNAEEIAQWLYANGYHVAAYTIRNQLDIRNSRIRELEAQEKSEPVDDVDSPAGTLGGNTPPVGVSIRCRKCGEMTDVSFNYGHAIDGCCNQSPCSRPGVGPCTRPAERIKVPDGMCLVAREDANNYCRILTLLGMEEEGDPVAEIETLLAERVRVPDGDPMEALREERLTLLNGFGQGAFADGRLRERIAEIDAMLSAAPEGGYHG